MYNTKHDTQHWQSKKSRNCGKDKKSSLTHLQRKVPPRVPHDVHGHDLLLLLLILIPTRRPWLDDVWHRSLSWSFSDLCIYVRVSSRQRTHGRVDVVFTEVNQVRCCIVSASTLWASKVRTLEREWRVERGLGLHKRCTTTDTQRGSTSGTMSKILTCWVAPVP